MRATAALFVSTDDTEQAHARHVIETTLGRDGFLANVIWQKKYTRANDARYFSDNHDFLLVGLPCRDDFAIGLLQRTDAQSAAYLNPDKHPKGPWKATPLHAKSGASSEFAYTFRNGVQWSPPPGTFARYSLETLEQLDAGDEIWFGPDGLSVPSRKSFLCDVKEGVTPVTIWPYEEVGHNHEATNELKSLFPSNPFSNPKPTRLIARVAEVSAVRDRECLLDFFAGSGTTGHAVIALNREGIGRRRFILTEMGAHFDTVLVPRLKKVTFTPEWKDGKPKRLATPEEADRSPRIMKIVRLESYEDTLNNLDIRRSEQQKSLLEEPAAKGDGKLREQYLLKYMLDVETRGSQSLLNVAAFRDPTAYQLSVKRPGSDESRELCVDLLETFNWLIGLTVEAIAAPQVFSASFERDEEKRLQLKGGRIKADPAGPFWFRRVEGKLPDGRKALVVWRKLGDDLEQANLVLDHFLTEKLKISTKDFEFDVIYVNGSNNLENLKAPNDTWKVRLLEQEFHRLMFATEDV